MITAMKEQINRASSQIRQAFLGIVARSGQRLQLKGLSSEVLQDVDSIQHVGFASGLPVDCRVVVLPLQGKTGRAVVIASRGGPVVVEVTEGETCIYDQFGHKILLAEGGIFMKGSVFVDGPLTATEISDSKGSIQNMRDKYNAHGGHSNGTAQPRME